MAMPPPGTRIGKCVNIGNCSLADRREIIEVKPGADFLCPECTKGLIVMQPGGSGGFGGVPPWAIAAGAAVLLIGGGYAAYQAFVPDKIPGTTVPETPGNTPVPPPATDAALLRLGGSNTIGDKLAPALVEGWLKKEKGCGEVATESPEKDEYRLTCTAGGKTLRVTISAKGTGKGFEGLAAGNFDIVMASDAIDQKNVDALAATAGDMRSPAAEHVIGMDGIAVIVNQSNRVPNLTMAQVAGLFSGAIADWSLVGGSAGPVTVYARDDNSGTWKYFDRQVLKAYSSSLKADAQRFEKGSELADKVATNPGGIGFVGAASAEVARVLPLVSQRGGNALLPNRFTIGTEDYALSRRMFLYVPPKGSNIEAQRFIGFVGSDAGQEIVAATKFVPRTLIAKRGDALVPGMAAAPAAYTAATGGGERLSTNFYFRSASAELDNKALGADPDVRRVVDYLSRNNITPDRLLLIGFADSQGDPAANIRLSTDRANTVARALSAESIRPGVIVGFGQAMPIADNSSPEGRAKNRRVEIWIKP